MGWTRAGTVCLQPRGQSYPRLEPEERGSRLKEVVLSLYSGETPPGVCPQLWSPQSSVQLPCGEAWQRSCEQQPLTGAGYGTARRALRPPLCWSNPAPPKSNTYH